MKLASLRGMAFANNEIFNSKNPSNRDNCFEPYIFLRDEMKNAGIILNTCDLNDNSQVDLEIHHDVQDVSSSNIQYLLMLESHLIAKKNGESVNWGKYRKVFTWRDDLVDGRKFIKINIPNPILVPDVDGWGQRDRFCALIAGNKSLSFFDVRDLYTERVKTIRWFEKNAIDDFDLYGVDWDIPPPPVGRFRNVHRKFWRKVTSFVRLNPFPSYKGRVKNKRDVLLKTKYAICYENVRDLPGYISEKIFDCFFSGCVPVYWGANNIVDHIPSDCFIDRRKFSNESDLYKHLKSLTEEQFVFYQNNIVTFLRSDAGRKFGAKFFAETIVNAIVQDLEC